MELLNVSARSSLSGRVKSAQYGVSGNQIVGLGDKNRVYPLANIIGTYKVAAIANASVATHTLATGVVASGTNSPVISEGDGKDAEGITFPTLAKIQAIRITTPSTNVGTVALTGSSSGVLPAITLGADSEIMIKFPEAGTTLSAATLIHTLSASGDSVSVEFIGKS